MKRFVLALLCLLWTAPAFATEYGPSPSIACDVGAVAVATTDDLQTKIDANPGGTSFCLAAGTHAVSSTAVPKSNDTFICVYGGVIDGTGWTTSDDNDAAISSTNAGGPITGVTIKNCEFRGMPRYAIRSYDNVGTSWTIQNNNIHHNVSGVQIGDDAVVENNSIHDNIGTPTSNTYNLRGGGYGGYHTTDATIQTNEFYRNGPEQKFVASTGVTISDNYFHDDYADSIWFDASNTTYTVSGNTVERPGRHGIDLEISGSGTVSNNTITGAADSAVFVSATNGATVSGNTITNSFRGVNLFVDCNRIGAAGLNGVTFDLNTVAITSNTITVPSTSGSFGGFFRAINCSSTQLAAFMNPAVKGLVFTTNNYQVPSTSGSYWYWGTGSKTFTQWQAIPQDTAGTLNQPCSFAVSPSAVWPEAAGGTQSLTLTASASSCAWTASSTQSWLSVGTTSGTGSGSSLITIAENTDPDPRSGSILIAGLSVPFTQAGASVTVTPPSAPTSLKIAAPSIGTDHLTLTWADTSTDEAQFEIAQSTDNVTFAPAGTVQANVTSATITGLTSNTLYYFKVRAVNAGGASSYSNTASARTLTAVSLTLSVSVTQDRKFFYANLAWVPSSPADIYRDGVLIATVGNQTYYTDRLRKTGHNRSTQPATYQVCVTNSTNCSNSVTVSF